MIPPTHQMRPTMQCQIFQKLTAWLPWWPTNCGLLLTNALTRIEYIWLILWDRTVSCIIHPPTWSVFPCPYTCFEHTPASTKEDYILRHLKWKHTAIKCKIRLWKFNALAWNYTRNSRHWVGLSNNIFQREMISFHVRRQGLSMEAFMNATLNAKRVFMHWKKLARHHINVPLLNIFLILMVKSRVIIIEKTFYSSF